MKKGELARHTPKKKASGFRHFARSASSVQLGGQLRSQVPHPSEREGPSAAFAELGRGLVPWADRQPLLARAKPRCPTRRMPEWATTAVGRRTIPASRTSSSCSTSRAPWKVRRASLDIAHVSNLILVPSFCVPLRPFFAVQCACVCPCAPLPGASGSCCSRRRT